MKELRIYSLAILYYLMMMACNVGILLKHSNYYMDQVLYPESCPEHEEPSHEVVQKAYKTSSKIQLFYTMNYIWNSLPETVVLVTTVLVLKQNYNKSTQYSQLLLLYNGH